MISHKKVLNVTAGIAQRVQELTTRPTTCGKELRVRWFTKLILSEHNYPWNAYFRSYTQKKRHILWNPKVHCLVHKILSVVRRLRASTIGSFKRYAPSSYQNQPFCMYLSFVSYIRNSYPSKFPSFDIWLHKEEHG
jgi:hypothetical protein